MKVGKLLKQFSNETGIEQKEIAGKLGYSPQRVNNYFRDIAEPPRAFFDNFQKVFQVDLKRAGDKVRKNGASKLSSLHPVPVYDVEIAAGDLEFFNHDQLITCYIDVPFYGDCSCAVKVTEAAMSPDFNPGDVVVLKKIMNADIIPYGEPFLVLTEELILLRYIRRNHNDPDTSFILRATHQQHDDIVIKKADVKHLFQVKGKLTRR